LQVGNVTIERGTWLRPEDIDYERPMFFVDPTMPGTDLLGSAAAGMAAAAGGGPAGCRYH
jgi:hypothetical protein